MIYKLIISDVGGLVDSFKNLLKWLLDDFGGFFIVIFIVGFIFLCYFNILFMYGEL